MNFFKLFLYGALGIVCVTLWNAWQADYPPVSETTPPTATTQASTNAKAVRSNERILQNLSAPVPPRRLVTIHTDVFNVAIDTLGGNLVKAELLKYPVSLIGKNVPVQLLNDDPERIYVANSGLISPEGPDLSFDRQAQFRVGQQSYDLGPEQNELNVQLTWQKNGLSVTKNFYFTRGKYDIKVTYDIDNQTGQTWQGDFFVELQKKELLEEKSGGFLRFRTFTGAAISSPDNAYEKLSYDNLEKSNLSRIIKGGWLSFQQQYFLSAWVPVQGESYHYFSKSLPKQIYALGLTDNLKVPPSSKETVGATLYVGPEVAASLKALANNLDRTVDYGWFWFISIGLFWLLQQIYKLIGNWGFAIILLTVLIKVAFYKFSEKSYRSMAKMRELAPRLQLLKERYGNDKQKLQQATMEIYRKEKVNPLGGCLPIVIQIPVFIALYYVLVEAVELRQAPFILWIHDLSIRDPYYVLPILMGISMLFQQKLNPAPPDPMQAKIMMFLPVVFTVFFLSFPAGLVLYWLVNNCLSILQQWYIMREVEKAHKKHE